MLRIIWLRVGVCPDESLKKKDARSLKEFTADENIHWHHRTSTQGLTLSEASKKQTMSDSCGDFVSGWLLVVSVREGSTSHAGRSTERETTGPKGRHHVHQLASFYIMFNLGEITAAHQHSQVSPFIVSHPSYPSTATTVSASCSPIKSEIVRFKAEMDRAEQVQMSQTPCTTFGLDQYRLSNFSTTSFLNTQNPNPVPPLKTSSRTSKMRPKRKCMNLSYVLILSFARAVILS